MVFNDGFLCLPCKSFRNEKDKTLNKKKITVATPNKTKTPSVIFLDMYFITLQILSFTK
jgi:hypothetical protein